MTVLTGIFIVTSIGILVAHALEALRSILEIDIACESWAR